MWTAMLRQALYALVFVYADDILLLAPSVLALQSLLHVCEQELLQFDMAVNVRKSSCTCIGARFDAKCCCVTTLNGAALAWTDTVIYLVVYIATETHIFCNYFLHFWDP